MNKIHELLRRLRLLRLLCPTLSQTTNPPRATLNIKRNATKISQSTTGLSALGM